jgi:hypothetical protein
MMALKAAHSGLSSLPLLVRLKSPDLRSPCQRASALAHEKLGEAHSLPQASRPDTL